MYSRACATIIQYIIYTHVYCSESNGRKFKSHRVVMIIQCARARIIPVVLCVIFIETSPVISFDNLKNNSCTNTDTHVCTGPADKITLDGTFGEGANGNIGKLIHFCKLRFLRFCPNPNKIVIFLRRTQFKTVHFMVHKSEFVRIRLMLFDKQIIDTFSTSNEYCYLKLSKMKMF